MIATSNDREFPVMKDNNEPSAGDRFNGVFVDLPQGWNGTGDWTGGKNFGARLLRAAQQANQDSNECPKTHRV
jgi:hypothetical protein